MIERISQMEKEKRTFNSINVYRNTEVASFFKINPYDKRKALVKYQNLELYHLSCKYNLMYFAAQIFWNVPFDKIKNWQCVCQNQITSP